MYCDGVLTYDGGFTDSPSSRTKCITERLKTSQRQGLCHTWMTRGKSFVYRSTTAQAGVPVLHNLQSLQRRRGRLRSTNFAAHSRGRLCHTVLLYTQS